jgi:hypothetical protein
VRNELKRTRNEPKLSAEMRALRVEFEFSSTSQVLVETSSRKDDRGRNLPVGGIERTAREYENRGNEAKKCLKTKHITFLNVAHLACFVRELTAISPQREQNDATFCENEVKTCDSQCDGMTVTSSRLAELGTSLSADVISGRAAASYRRIVAFWRTTLIPHPFWGKLE